MSIQPHLSALKSVPTLPTGPYFSIVSRKAKALDMFNKGEGGFRDRDLYVFCANASDGIFTAHPYLKGKHLQELEGKKGYPFGQEMMQKASEGL